MRVAAAYIRVSTDDQIEFSPGSQLEKIRLYAEKNQIFLPDEFVFSDEGISGRNTDKRPAFNKMIGIAKRKPKPFDIILVWKFSRFSRSREDSVVYKSMLRKELGIDVVSVSEDVGDDKMSVLFEAMIEAMDEYYSINLAEEVKRGMTEKAKKGGVLTVPAFGYKVENGEFAPILQEAEVIRKVFYDYLSGKEPPAIARQLNELGIRTHRGNKIESRTVAYWLKNPVYIGKIRWNPDRTHKGSTIISDGMHAPIIDVKIWNRVQEKLASRKFGRYYNSGKKDLSHWLLGVVRCEKCGGVLSNQGGYFGCAKKGRGKCTGVGYIKAEKLDKIIEMLDEIMLPDVTLRFSEPTYGNNKNADKKIILSQIKKLDYRLERIKSAYEDGSDTLEEYSSCKKKILDAKEALKKSLKAEIPKTEIKELRRMTDILKDDSVSNAEKNKIAKAIFKEIVKGENTLKCVFWE